MAVKAHRSIFGLWVRLGILIAATACILAVVHHFREQRPDQWSWNLVRNGKVYSYTQHQWVRYPLDVQGDDWALKTLLDNFHQLHRLPPIVWVDEHRETTITNGLYGCTATPSGFFSIPKVGVSLETSSGWKMSVVEGVYKIKSAQGEIRLGLFSEVKTPEKALQMTIATDDRKFLHSELFVTKSGLKGIKGYFGGNKTTQYAVQYFLSNAKGEVVFISVSPCASKKDQDAVEMVIIETLQYAKK